jgi:transcriptional regulator with XRE-family HTH domain
VDELHRRVVRHIRERAKSLKIPVTHLPDRAGVSRSHFWEVMAGRRSPTLKWLGQLAKALDVDAGNLVAQDGG